VTRWVLQLVRDERSGGAGFAAALRGGRRLHRDRRGQISVLFILVGLAFFVAAAMVWNTGTTTAVRMHAQAAADTSAYSSAVWTSRTVNNVTGTNMLIARHASAWVAASAAMAVAAGVPANWHAWASEKAEACGEFYPLCYAAFMAYLQVTEGPYYYPFLFKAVASGAAPTVFIKAPGRISDLYRYEKAWVAATPDVIEAQRRLLEEYYDCEIRLTRPGDGDGLIRPPLKRGNPIDFTTVLHARFWVFGHDNKWPKDGHFDRIVHGKANLLWRGAAESAIAAISAWKGSDHYVLDVPVVIGERGPSSLGERAKFTVVATARMTGRTRGRLMAAGAFRYPVVPSDRLLACAQAETFNGIDGRLEKIGIPVVGPILRAYPFRVWTTFGWQWQPRLARGDQLGNALQGDATLRRWYGDISVTAGSTANWSNLEQITLH
jgi:hypothetical protein